MSSSLWRKLICLSMIVAAAAAATAQAGPAEKVETKVAANARPSMAERREAEVLETWAKFRPDQHKQLLELKKSDPDEYAKVIRRLWSLYTQMRGKPENVQEAYLTIEEVRQRASDVIAEMHRTDNPQKKADLNKRLQKIAEDEFEAHQTIREYKLSEVAKDIERLRKKLKERQDNKAEIVQRRVEQMLRSYKPRNDGKSEPTTQPSPKVMDPRMEDNPKD